MELIDLRVPLEEDGTWSCSHVDQLNNVAPGRTLCVADAVPLVTTFRPTSATRRSSISCPACGALWRVWHESRIAKPAIELTREMQLRTYSLRRSPLLDIDEIILRVRGERPSLIVAQNLQSHLCDDEGLWWFSLGDSMRNLQAESSTGQCPFLIEATIDEEPDFRLTAISVAATEDAILKYMR
jgi:hypothetical protein